MFYKLLPKITFVVLACILTFYGYTNLKINTIITNLDENIKMGRYQHAFSTIRKLEENPFIRKLSEKDPLITYNKGVLYSLLMENKKASDEYRKTMETKDPVLKARAIYNNANIIAEDMDFSTAAMQYVEALKIDPADFQAKKNLERMRLGEMQFNTMFSHKQEEREDRIESLKLIPWGTKYRYSGEQKIRW
ncbi:hypothetical protein KsCSTR_24310 [Candidatus Kuenenia stuttgartiensis]|jgi:tetratricopeptide (TPR) repeat protein|nr:hypothetical protein [Candidatus Kuenenia stuttgartiensis]MBE7546834.1 hypothetical protein [Planctomycetia bacterium]MBW7941125.1 hypothetical protein [Candidatus Kuenenia stuttgartiensis]MBZ0191761.1 hypothetical protein [Candidatus Kuenenia stuttgartiensis]MCF6153257.1 hypothetical protein [Candidatus Kuenenia stuttgartiensis]MCL4727949.1 hypothetical protein [Candidatus Kuenenia stuttgartiensis]